MNVDHFVRGKEEVCQDYALSGMEPVPYVIIADGCSSAKYSDVGAMALAHAARNVLGKYSNRVIEDYHAFGMSVIGQAENIANTIGRPKTILDATLGIIWIKDKTAFVRFYGDGVLFLALIIKAWNSYISGEKIKFLRWSPGAKEEFPEVLKN